MSIARRISRLLSLLRDELLSPGSVEELQRDVDKIFADAKQHAGIDQETRAARARALDAEISRLVDGIATVGVSEALADRLRAAEAAELPSPTSQWRYLWPHHRTLRHITNNWFWTCRRRSKPTPIAPER
jgi:hypothetical protein